MLHIFLIIFGAILILVVWGAGFYFYGRSTAETQDEGDITRVRSERDKAQKSARELEALAYDYSEQYAGLKREHDAVVREYVLSNQKIDSLTELHKHCRKTAPPVVDIDENSTQLAFYQEFTGIFPIIGELVDGNSDHTLGWDRRKLRESIEHYAEDVRVLEAFGPIDRLALPAGGAQ